MQLECGSSETELFVFDPGWGKVHVDPQTGHLAELYDHVPRNMKLAGGIQIWFLVPRYRLTDGSCMFRVLPGNLSEFKHYSIEVIQDEINHFGLDDIITVGFRERKIDDDTIDSFIRLFIYDKNKQGRRIIISGVDIFPYDYLKNYDKDKLDKIYYDAKLKYFRNIAKKMDYNEALKIMHDDINMSMEPAKYVVPGVEGAHGLRNLYKLKVLDADKLFPLSEVQLLNKTFPAPGNPDYHLYNIYRIYNKIPVNVRHHNRVIKYRYLDNRKELFDYYLNRLKEVNKDYE